MSLGVGRVVEGESGVGIMTHAGHNQIRQAWGAALVTKQFAQVLECHYVAARQFVLVVYRRKIDVLRNWGALMAYVIQDVLTLVWHALVARGIPIVA